MRADPAAGSAPARASARACGPPAARPTIRAGGRRCGRRRTAIFEDAVLRALARWPDVPGVFGWLGLDCRGRWRLEGELIGNEAANRFIDRNYARDEAGRWFFQNGPQQVFVTLEYAPPVYRLDDAGTRPHGPNRARGEGRVPGRGAEPHGGGRSRAGARGRPGPRSPLRAPRVPGRRADGRRHAGGETRRSRRGRQGARSRSRLGGRRVPPIGFILAAVLPDGPASRALLIPAIRAVPAASALV